MQAQGQDAFKKGVRTALAPAGLVLILTFFAFGALVKATDLPLIFGVSLTLFVFAIPGQVVLVDELARNAIPFAIFMSVMLTAIRLLPLTLSLMAVLRTPQTPKWLLYLLAHFIAVTVWVQSMISLPKLPKEQRAIHCLGLCMGLLGLTTLSTITGFYTAHLLPPIAVAATLMVTPTYFFLSLITTSQTFTDRLAFLLGVLLAIPLALYWPQLALLGAGLIGGTLAYLIGRMKRARQQTDKEV